MKPLWPDTDRELAYTAVCEAVSAAGKDGETAFLARLTLLLAEELSDLTAFRRALAGARSAEVPTD